MPWTPGDAESHTRRASTPELRELWARIANDALARGASDASAIKQANAVVRRRHRARRLRLV